MIIFQTLSAVGAGVYIILAHIIMKVPNGKEIVRDLLGVQNTPLMLIGFMTILCIAGSIATLLYNLQKEGEK